MAVSQSLSVISDDISGKPTQSAASDDIPRINSPPASDDIPRINSPPASYDIPETYLLCGPDNSPRHLCPADSDSVPRKTLPPGSDVYEYVLGDFRSRSKQKSSSPISFSSALLSAVNSYDASCSHSLTSEEGKRRVIYPDVQIVPSAQGEDHLGIASLLKSKSAGPRVGQKQESIFYFGQHFATNGFTQNADRAQDEKENFQKRKYTSKQEIAKDLGQERAHAVDICDFVADLNSHISGGGSPGMGNNPSLSSGPEAVLTVHDHRSLFRLSTSPKSNTKLKGPRPNHHSDNKTVSHPMGNQHATGGHPAKRTGTFDTADGCPKSGGHIVKWSASSAHSKRDSSSQTMQIDKKDPRVDGHEPPATGHSHAMLSRLYPRSDPPGNKLSDQSGGWDSAFETQEDRDGWQELEELDKENDSLGTPGESKKLEPCTVASQRPNPTSTVAVRHLTSPPDTVDIARPRKHLDSLSSASSPNVRQSSDHTLNSPMFSVTHVTSHTSKQHAGFVSSRGLPEVGISSNNNVPPDNEQYRQRSQSDVSVHMRRRLLPRIPLPFHRLDVDHARVHWADEEKGSPLATSVVVTSIRPRAFSHGSVDMPAKPILKKPVGF